MPFGYAKQPVKANISYPVRALNTIYQNLTGRPLLVIVTLVCIRRTNDTEAYGIAEVQSVTPPTLVASRAGLTIDGAITETVESEYGCLVFAVPNEFYYRVRNLEAGASTVTVNQWTEVEL